MVRYEKLGSADAVSAPERGIRLAVATDVPASRDGLPANDLAGVP